MTFQEPVCCPITPCSDQTRTCIHNSHPDLGQDPKNRQYAPFLWELYVSHRKQSQRYDTTCEMGIRTARPQRAVICPLFIPWRQLGRWTPQSETYPCHRNHAFSHANSPATRTKRRDRSNNHRVARPCATLRDKPCRRTMPSNGSFVICAWLISEFQVLVSPENSKYPDLIFMQDDVYPGDGGLHRRAACQIPN